MDRLKSFIFCGILLTFAQYALAERFSCVLDFECEECLPDNMPIVSSHRFNGSKVFIPQGDEVTFSCEKGKFFMYPLRSVLRAYCDEDRYRVHEDNSIRHALELGCQENVFEDVLHHVEECNIPFQGRAYLTHTTKGTVKHLAEICFDQDSAIPVFIKIVNHLNNEMPVPPQHSDSESPLSLLGNFNHMFDSKTRSEAEQLFTDSEKMNKRMYEKLKHDEFKFASQSLTGAKLLPGEYFKDQNTRASNFISNRIPLWRSVAEGNAKHLARDVANMLKATPENENVDVFVGTHNIFTAKYSGLKEPVYLKPGKRFPIPKYIWTVVFDETNRKGVAIVTMNDPYVAVSEIRNSVFCESVCTKISWLYELRKNQHFETPLYGLTFCCDINTFAQNVPKMPQSILAKVQSGEGGLLTNIPGY